MLAEKTQQKMETPESKEQGKEIKMVLKLSLVEHKTNSHNLSNAGDLV